LEHDQHLTIDRLNALIQSLAACKCLGILQLNPKDRIIRHHRSGPTHKQNASS
jgi:hypothetical protein